MQKKNPIVVPCSACRKEIPKSAALTPEGADYVRHFCSKDCYQKWYATQKKT